MAQTIDSYYETRAAAVLAYCSRLCPPERVAASVDAAFARARDDSPGGPASRDARLRVAARRAVADHVRGGDGDYCAIVPRLLAARAEHVLKPAEDDTLGDHLDRCPACAAIAARFDEAERVLDALLPAPATNGVAPQPVVEPAPVTNGVAPAPVVEPPPAAEPSPPRPAETEPRPPVPRRPRLSPALRRHASAVLFVLGVLLIAEAVTTVVWKEPLTAYLASRAQAALRGELSKLSSGRLDAAEQRSVAALATERLRTERRLALLAHNLGARAHSGQALGWIEIPKIGVDYVFVQGTDAASLRKGPAHYLDTPLPGEPGTVGVAGHRTTYLAPFRDIDALRRGDRIAVRMPYGRFTYAVERHRIVPASYRQAFQPPGYDRLVLSACHPLYSASQRILVSARLVSVRPLGAARGAPARPGQAAAQLAALGGRQLALGMSGPDVRELQRLLGVPTSGYFGYETESAVVGFARAHGLDSSGTVDYPFKQALAQRGPPTAPPTPPDVAPQGPR